MNILVQISMLSADVVSGPLNVFFESFGGWILYLLTGAAVVHSFASGAITYSNIPEELLASARRWHGTIDDQYSNIDNLVTLIQSHSWGTLSILSQLIVNRTQLATLISKCRSGQASAIDRGQRNILLKTTVGLCLGQAKSWAYTQYYAGVMTLNDVHSLGFLLPGETGGHHSRAEATNVAAEVKVTILSADVIHVVIDQASTDNAALVHHGWPPSVRQAVIVITASDGLTEVLRLQTTRLHNEIKMPAGSHGKQFIIKAAFLRHIDDEPLFGPQPTFTMPFTTEDLAAALDRQHHEEYEAHIREIERQRLEIEQLRAALHPPTHE